MHGSSHIHQKSLFISFHSLILLITQGGDKVKLAKCETSKWNENYHYANDIPFKCPHG